MYSLPAHLSDLGESESASLGDYAREDDTPDMRSVDAIAQETGVGIQSCQDPRSDAVFAEWDFKAPAATSGHRQN